MIEKLRHFSGVADRLIDRTGPLFSWTLVLLLVGILIQVTLRYVFSHDLVAMSELQWHFYAVAVMISLSYAQVHGAHVRVDLFYRHFPQGLQRGIEAMAVGLLLIPLIAFIFWHGCQFTAESFRVGETSASPGGLPWRWAIKAFIPIGAGLFLVSSFALLLRLILGSAITRGPEEPGTSRGSGAEPPA